MVRRSTTVRSTVLFTYSGGEDVSSDFFSIRSQVFNFPQLLGFFFVSFEHRSISDKKNKSNSKTEEHLLLERAGPWTPEDQNA